MNKTQSNINSNLPILPELQLIVNVFCKKTDQTIQRGPSHETVVMRHCDYNWSWQHFPVENLNCCPYHHFLNFRNYCFHTHWHYNCFWHPSLQNTSSSARLLGDQAWTALFKFPLQILNCSEIWAWTRQLGNIHCLAHKQFVCLLLCAWCLCSAASFTQGNFKQQNDFFSLLYKNNSYLLMLWL